MKHRLLWSTKRTAVVDAAWFLVHRNGWGTNAFGLSQLENCEKNSSFGMEGELGRAFSRGAYPGTSSEISEVILVFGTTRDGEVVGALNGECIVDTKIQIESIRPELSSKSTTKEHGAKGIANGLM